MNTFLFVPLPNIILTQLYWFSLLFIGYISIHVGLSIIKNKKLTTTWNNIPGFAKLSLTFASACVLFTIYTILGYLLKLPSVWLSISYLGTLLATTSIAATYLIKHRAMPRDVVLAVKGLKSIRLLSLSTLLIVSVVLAYGVATVLGSVLFGDVFVHLSKIRHLATDGFTFTDMYFKTVPETRYTISLLHTLIAIPNYLGIGDINSWLASLAPLKLFLWSSVYYLAWYVFKLSGFAGKRLAFYSTFSTILFVAATILAPIAFTYPNHMVIIWIVLYVIGFIELFNNKNIYPIIFASLLITFTHPLDSLAILLFVAAALVGVAIFSWRSFNKTNIITMIATSLVLLIMPVVTYLQPDNMSEAAFDYGIGKKFTLTTLFGQKIFSPSLSSFAGTEQLPIIWTILSLIGLVAIVILVKGKVTKVIIGSLVLFMPLFLYNPLSMAVLSKILPYWSVVRFPAVNVIALISIPIGIIAILILLTKLVKKFNFSSEFILIIIAVVVAVSIPLPYGPDSRWLEYAETTKQQYGRKKYEVNNVENIRRVVSGVEKDATILAYRKISSVIPAISTQTVVSISYFNSTPAADSANRIACNAKMLKNHDRGLMKQVGVDYIVVRSSEAAYKYIHKHPEEFTQLKKVHNIYLFSVNYDGVAKSHDSICVFNEN